MQASESVPNVNGFLKEEVGVLNVDLELTELFVSMETKLTAT